MEVCLAPLEVMENQQHYPVMHQEALELLDIARRRVVVDCTVGVGSHALTFLEVMRDDSLLIGIDRDEDSLARASERLQQYKGRVILVKSDFAHVDKVLRDLQVSEVDAFFFDLGISTYQLYHHQRGFSFLKDGPLDMRMDRNGFLCAYDLVNSLSQRELENIFRRFGEERYAKRIATVFVQERKRQPLSTTRQLVQAIFKALPPKAFKYKIHPATRIFQALRIAVNRELEVLPSALSKAIPFLNEGGRIGVISFHSLEDRIVKHTIRKFVAEGLCSFVTKKPLVPGEAERDQNNASRSAKFRVAEKRKS